MMLTPPVCRPDDVPGLLRGQGYAVLDPQGAAGLAGCSVNDLLALRPAWEGLPPDHYLKDGGHYRRRRHSCFVVEGDAVTQAPHRAHWQPVEYNALHGGMQRWFEPMEPAILASPAWPKLLRALGQVTSDLKGPRPWYVEAHQFRIDTEGGIGRPTPEGAHRDGVDLVAVFLVSREGIKGGETRVFQADGPAGQRFTLTEPWSLLLLDDEHVIHESTPIQPVDGQGHRDTLVLTYRAGGFQGG
ncbi:MAG TPA: 2OG-Fe dioxygenase family protein [Ramlibacter sp.]|nr:2OG-Fe dioxygenase family protein [Ramlibacter sp.]